MRLFLVLLALVLLANAQSEQYAFCGEFKCKYSWSGQCTESGLSADKDKDTDLQSCPSGYLHLKFCEFDRSWPSADQYIRKCIRDPNVTYSWDASDWSSCPTACGQSFGQYSHTRSVKCIDNNGKTANGSFCNSNNKPSTTGSYCPSTATCTYAFCGEHKCIKSASSTCTESGLSADKDKTDLQSCPSGYSVVKHCKYDRAWPAADQYILKCMLKSSITYVWKTYNWSSCPTVCGQTSGQYTHTRNVKCIGSDGNEASYESYCTGSKPATIGSKCPATATCTYAFCGEHKCIKTAYGNCTESGLTADKDKSDLKTCPSGYKTVDHCKFKRDFYAADQYTLKCKLNSSNDVNITQNGQISNKDNGNSSKSPNSNNGGSSQSSNGNKNSHGDVNINITQKNKPHGCSQNPCKNNSQCRTTSLICVNGGCQGGQAYCTCVGGFTGPTCEIPPNPCANNYCKNGSCSVLDGKPVCSCKYGFEGTTCSVKTNRTNKTAATTTASSATNFFTCTWLLLFALMH